jgi:hypothetical protein
MSRAFHVLGDAAASGTTLLTSFSERAAFPGQRRCVCPWLIATLLTAAPLYLYAQELRSIHGTVRDESGATVQGAKVELTCGNGSFKSSATTDNGGSFAFVNAPPAACHIRAEKAHFDPATVETGLASASGEMEITLKVAAVRQSVNVVRDASEELDYAVDHATSATKLDTPIMETPFSIDVVSPQVLRDQQAIRLQDATRNISGVQTNFGYGGLYEAFALRGFETNVTLRNGERVAGGIGRSSVDMANVQEVEVLKGPAAMLYGRLEPGGMINVITKNPLSTPHYSIQQQFGSYNLFRTTADATGPVLRDGSLLYRAIYSFFDSDQFIVHAPTATRSSSLRASRGVPRKNSWPMSMWNIEVWIL